MSPHFSPDYGMIAPDFLMCAIHGAHPLGDLRSSKSAPGRFVLLRVPATESIVVPMVEEARARRSKKGQQERIIW